MKQVENDFWMEKQQTQKFSYEKTKYTLYTCILYMSYAMYIFNDLFFSFLKNNFKENKKKKTKKLPKKKKKLNTTNKIFMDFFSLFEKKNIRLFKI